MSRLSRLNSPTAIWWQFSVRAQEQSACDTVGIHTYIDGCVLPTTSIIHQLDDKWPAGDDSCSSRKEVSVAEEEANLEKDTHARASEFLGFPPRRSASSAKNKTQKNRDIFDQYKNG